MMVFGLFLALTGPVYDATTTEHSKVQLPCYDQKALLSGTNSPLLGLKLSHPFILQ